MNALVLFAYGLLVTLVVAVAIGLLVWGAILDGRYDREVRREMEQARRRPLGAQADEPPLELVS
jgi:hypothetical protein